MITIPQLTAHALGSFLAQETQDLFGSSPSGLPELLPFAARLTLEFIGNSDALYHNIEHTMLLTLVGHDILVGRALQRATTVADYANFIMACLTHDIGYVRGVVQGDEMTPSVAILRGAKSVCPVGSSDAALAPYHVDRSKLFVIERFDSNEESRRGPNCPRHRICPLSLRRYAKTRCRRPQRGGRIAAARGRPDRPARRSITAEIERPVSRIRGNRAEQDAGLRHARRHRLQVPAVLLDQRGPADPRAIRYLNVPPAAASGSPTSTQRLPGRTRSEPVRAATMGFYTGAGTGWKYRQKAPATSGINAVI